jgi:hypothetical protein
MNERQIAILEKLIYLKCIGGRHTSKDNVIKGFPTHERGNIKKELGNLIKKGYILQKPTSYGMEVSINPKVLSEIRRFLESNS